MSVPPGQELGWETHDDSDQFFRVEGGRATVETPLFTRYLKDGDSFVVEAGIRHNVKNTSDTEALKLYTIYSPAVHPEGTLDKTHEAELIRESQTGGGKKVPKRGYMELVWKEDKKRKLPTKNCCCLNKKNQPCGVRVGRRNLDEMDCHVHRRHGCQNPHTLYNRCVASSQTPLLPASSLSDNDKTPKELVEQFSKMKINRDTCIVEVKSMSRLLGLEGGGWLNDEIINCYLQNLVQTDPSLYFFNSWIFERLYQNFERYTSKRILDKIDITDKKHIFLPINEGHNHWTLVDIQPLSGKITYYDSFGNNIKQREKDLIERYLKAILDHTVPNWTWKQGFSEALQKTGKDCGVFVLMTARALAFGNDISQVKQSNCPQFRKDIAVELMHYLR